MYNIPPNTLFVGKNLVYLPTCHSTNDIATDLILKKKAPEGTVVVTSDQTAGRGQRGNNWEAEKGKNFTLSIILFPKFLKATQQFYLNMAMSLACYEFLYHFLDDEKLKIKWSNDIYYENKKLSGMLIENTIKGYNLESTVVGIGININQENFNEAKAGSLKKIKNQNFNLEEILSILLEKIEKFYFKVKNESFSELKENYIRNQYQFNDIKKYKIAEGENIEGKIIDIEDTGMLVIETINLEILKFSFKEIIYL